MKYLVLDIETYSDAPIKLGVHKYSETARILMFQWVLVNHKEVKKSIDIEKIKVNVDFDKPSPELTTLLLDDAIPIIAHNAMFERVLISKCFPELDIKLSRWVCTMCMSLSAGLPGSLEKTCEYLNLDSFLQKDKKGKQLINLFCVPAKIIGKLHWSDIEGKPKGCKYSHPQKWKEFIEYGKQDVIATLALMINLPPTNFNRELYAVDQKINDIGFYIDMDFVIKVLDIYENRQEELKQDIFAKSEGGINSYAQRDALLRFINERYDLNLPDLRANTVENLLSSDDINESLKEILLNRLETVKGSAKKYKALFDRAIKEEDGYCIKGSLQFRGAQRTGRWAGRGVQPQNFKRQTLKPEVINKGIEDIKKGDISNLPIPFTNFIGEALRSVIIPPSGKKLIVADYTGIEGIILAWAAGAKRKIEMYKKDEDSYIATYSKVFHIPINEVTKDERQIGKVMELALGYAGGVSAFVSMADIYRIDLDNMARKVIKSAPVLIKNQAESFYEFTKLKGKLPASFLFEQTWIACECLKRMWREINPEIANLWSELDKSSKKCALTGQAIGKFRKVKNFLALKLPSNREIFYYRPQITPDGGLTYFGKLTGISAYSRISTYSGKLTENFTQAVSADILSDALLRLDKAGFKIHFHVHDEIIVSVDKNFSDLNGFVDIMTETPDWAEGLPLKAKASFCDRYNK